jgi:hypothetical protein
MVIRAIANAIVQAERIMAKVESRCLNKGQALYDEPDRPRLCGIRLEEIRGVDLSPDGGHNNEAESGE